MLKTALVHWKTSLFSVLGSSFVALAATAGADQMTTKQLLLVYAGCLAAAVKGLLSADADKVAAPK